MPPAVPIYSPAPLSTCLLRPPLLLAIVQAGAVAAHCCSICMEYKTETEDSWNYHAIRLKPQFINRLRMCIDGDDKGKSRADNVSRGSCPLQGLRPFRAANVSC